ncbi:MAG: GAF domain-containing protein [Deltaproteobacteria bacterium]|jgi:signal transduction histidine kinase|nr:GAF domain-containing protein [Deltaproteobacteria bacterium]
MERARTRRTRQITGSLAAIWALLAIGLSVFALISPSSGPHLPVRTSIIAGVAVVHAVGERAAAFEIEEGDQLLSVGGRPAIEAIWDPQLEAGVANDYRFRKPDGRIVRARLEPVLDEHVEKPGDVLLHLGLLLVSSLYLAIALAIWWSRSATAEAWALLLFCSTMSVLLSSAVRVDVIPWAATRVLSTLPFLGATSFHLFTTYPVEPRWVMKRRRIRLIPYAVAIGLSVAVLSRSAMHLTPTWIANGAFVFGVGLTIVSLAVLAGGRRQAREAGSGDRADLMLLAAAVTLLPPLLLLILEWLTPTTLPWYLGLLWLGFFPVAVGYGMARRQLIDLRVVAKSSAAYGTATLAITGIFAFMITFADELVARYGVNARSVQVVMLFLAILAFNPLRERMQGLVDGFFDRDRSRYRLAVREISEAMVSMLSLGEIGDRILAALTDTMGVSRAMVLLFDETDRVLRVEAWRGDWDQGDIDVEIPSDHPIWKHLWMRREELTRADFDDEPDAEKRESCWDVYDTLEVELLVPILFGVDLLGVIAVGRKLSGEHLATDDRQLLRTLANQSSIAIENAKAFDEIAKLNESLELRVDERTRELQETQNQLMQAEKLKSLGQLVAGVAHELNNPIGFVHANLQLLDEFIEKLAGAQERGEDPSRYRDAITKLLLRSREGTERVKQIVQDLRTFSRTDQADLQSANLTEEIDRTLALMEPRFKGGVEVVRQYEDLPEVRCYPGQLNQVFLNLLMNACDVLEDGGTITIRARPIAIGVRLEFEDTGPGIPAEVQGRIFDPFFTTKEVGKGTGLGLSLSHGIIERHGGRIFVQSAEGRGTKFVIELPLVAPEIEEATEQAEPA